ncbi:DUF397 domain-containing protein [Streptomyces ardesiacus]|uniref:DUF397 domain-containing protein n=1 Tax=Streptomyces ardesiacus TaxID=285564 RepID=UPI00201EA660|nr:DUF397 domain-containing protein [Streptomyces ardesiacus]MCL7365960.1 DUF397 domain-containing protein [Streptomyces ardesiacus]
MNHSDSSAIASSLTWIRSSYSGAEGGQCVEVAWVKSSYSGTEGGQCVEIAAGTHAVLVRDSKAVPGPVIRVSRDAWAGFIGR